MSFHASFVASVLSPVAVSCRSLCMAAACAAAMGSAQAVVSEPQVTTDYGEIQQVAYGPTNIGLVYELKPYAFIEGLGLPDHALSVVERNPNLQFAKPVYSGFGTGLATVEYRITNVSTKFTFNDLRFMVFANPDGSLNVPYLDQAVLVEGAAAATNPTTWEARAITDTQLPSETVLSRFLSQRTLTKGVDAACLTAAGCDVEMALQWNAAALKPDESFVIKVGLSDDGRALSSVYLQALSRSDAATQLTFSGTGQVVAVPEAEVWALWAAGLAVVGAGMARRRQRV